MATGIFLFFVQFALAQGRVSLLPPPETPKESRSLPVPKEAQSKPQTDRRSNSRQPLDATGNLPQEYRSMVRTHQTFESAIILPAQKIGQILPEVHPGDLLEGEILESLIGFPDSKVPIRATVKRGQLQGAIFLGEASLEKNSKRILLQFTKVRRDKSDQVYQIAASGLSEDGTLGLTGVLNSGEATYFGAELLAAGAAGFSDSTIERGQNALGNYVEAPTLGNSTKRALAAAMTKTADRFSEKLKQVPEFVTLAGPTRIKILITEDGKTGL